MQAQLQEAMQELKKARGAISELQGALATSKAEAEELSWRRIKQNYGLRATWQGGGEKLERYRWMESAMEKWETQEQRLLDQ